MEFRILGPLEVLSEGSGVALGGRKLRALLALLLLHPNQTLSTDWLIEELWGERPPATAAKTLQVHVSRLRKALAAASADDSSGTVVTRDNGYELRVDPGHLDSLEFERLVTHGRNELESGRPGSATSALDTAMSLWRGRPLEDLAYEPFAQREIARLEDLRVAALEWLIEAKLALGRHSEVSGQLQALVAEHPYREGLRALQMLALYRSDRQAEALQAYQDARTTLVEELGIEPGERLRELERAILGQDAGLNLSVAEHPATDGPAPQRTFVGRQAELGELVAGLDGAFAGRGQLFLLAGEPGIGKSRLIEELVAHARARGALVLLGRCWEAGGAPAYWPWVESLRGYVTERDPGQLREELGAGALELAQLLPELQELLPDLGRQPTLDPKAARFRLFDAIGTFLRRAAAERPIVLGLDDLHAADESSLLLLQFLARGLRDSRLLVVGAYRDVDPTMRDPLQSALAELTREPVTRRISLRGLGESDVGEYISMTAGIEPDPQTVAAIHAQTEGNALFVGEVTRLLVAEGALEPGAAGGAGIPQGVRDVIGRRIRRLSDACRRTLTTASVLGREFAVEALSKMAGSEPRETLEVLDEALGARVLGVVPGAPGRLRFSHALVRDALFEDLTPARRLDLHIRAGEALEALYAENQEPHLAELAYHFAEAAPAGDTARAVGYARRAGDRAAALLAFEEATRLYRLALDLTDADDPAARPEYCELLIALGDVQSRAGDAPAARETFLHAAEIAREEGLPVQLGLSALGYGGRFVFTRGAGDPHVVPLLQQAAEALGSEDSALRARVLSRLASARRDEPAREPRAALSAQALEAAREVGNPTAVAYAISGRLSAMMGPDSFDERLALATELTDASDKEHALEGHLHRTVVHLALGDFSEIHADQAAAERLASELRQPTQQWLAVAVAATLAIVEGRLADADALMRRAAAIGERAQRYEMLSFLRLQEFGLRREQGRLGEVDEQLQEAPAEFPTRPVYRCMVAALHAELGRLEEARRMLADLAGGGLDFAAVPLNNDFLLSVALLSEVAAACGDANCSEVLYGLLEPYGPLNVDTLELSTGSVSRHLGLLAAVLGRIDDAVRHFEQALEMNERTGARLWLAHTRCDLGCLLLRRGSNGDRSRATALLEKASAAASELGLAVLEDRLRLIPART